MCAGCRDTGDGCGAPEPQIRWAHRHDAAEIASVLYGSFAQFEALYTPRAFATTVSSAEGVSKRLDEGPIWIGLIDERIVATASARVTKDGLYVRGMGVVPEARGRQLGWRFLERIERYADRHGLRRMYLSTTPFLTSAIRLYEGYGFGRSHEGPFDLFGTPLFTMDKTVVSAAG